MAIVALLEEVQFVLAGRVDAFWGPSERVAAE